MKRQLQRVRSKKYAERHRAKVRRFIILLAMMTDPRRIPKTQHEFDEYIRRVAIYLNTVRGTDPDVRGEMLGLTAQNVSDLVTKWYDKWFTGNPAGPGLWEIHENTYGPTNNKKNNKDVAKFMKDFRAFFQPLLNIMAVSTILDSEDRTQLNLPEADTTDTFHPVPDDRGPHGKIDKVEREKHKLRITDPDNPNPKEQPEGVMATRIYRAVKDQGVPPQPDDYILIGDTSSWKFISNFTPAQVGKRAHYYAVWIDTKRNEGVKGNDFSETVI
jgi:hypothetical protein